MGLCIWLVTLISALCTPRHFSILVLQRYFCFRYLTLYRGHTGATISLKHLFSRTCCVCFGHRQGNYLNMLYLLIKLLYLINAIVQLFLLEFFLNTDFSMYGITVVKAMIAGEDWTQSDRFPRVTMCDLKIRQLGNVHRYTVQCILPINLFHEKIFLVIWFWLVFLAIATSISLILWCQRTLFIRARYRYVKRNLDIAESEKKTKKERLVLFVERYLQQDGVFFLQMVGHNSDRITAHVLVTDLFNFYEKQKE